MGEMRTLKDKNVMIIALSFVGKPLTALPRMRPTQNYRIRD